MTRSAPAQPETAIATDEFLRDIEHGLTCPSQKYVPSQYLYDAVGSALFEVITLLPEYGLTRADERLLEASADTVPDYFDTTPVVAELGSGSGTKTRRVLSAFGGAGPGLYYPIDISVTALERCTSELGATEGLIVEPLACSYLDGLRRVVDRTADGQPLLVLFLGSTIGNFDRPHAGEFLSRIRETLRARDVLILGTDLEKPVADLLRAYDDSAGVTAAFNLNLLCRINRELDGEFDLSRFAHAARWNASERRIEMHLESLEHQSVRIGRADRVVDFERGETIWTESSHKFDREEVADMGRRAGFSCVAQWTDPEWPFAESVFLAD